MDDVRPPAFLRSRSGRRMPSRRNNTDGWALSCIIIRQRAKGDGRFRFIVADNAPTESNAEALLPPSGPGNFKSKSARWQAIIFMALSGVSASIGIFFVRQTFITDTKDQGPLAAVGSTDVIMSTLLCHFLLHERLNPKQWISVITVFLGVIVMCFGDEATENWPHVNRLYRRPVATSSVS
eukprot:GEMP01057838.1.p1 GENE.GEMP01057838.1~~GEMP01057838.1.p1  ORF type:complete len:181 (+),score=25.80 GEMP01057838.1:313-855(+)